MKNWQTDFKPEDVEIIHQHTEYKGFFQIDSLQLRHRQFDGQWTPVFQRELFERGQSAAILLYDSSREKVVLIEQFRVGVVYSQQSPWLLEIVAGIVEENEKPEQVVIRETKEETGLNVDKVYPIADFWLSPGGSTEHVHLFWGNVDADKAGGVHGNKNEHEDIRVVVADREEVLQALQDGKFQNAMTLIALQWLQLNYQALKAF